MAMVISTISSTIVSAFDILGSPRTPGGDSGIITQKFLEELTLFRTPQELDAGWCQTPREIAATTSILSLTYAESKTGVLRFWRSLVFGPAARMKLRQHAAA